MVVNMEPDKEDSKVGYTYPQWWEDEDVKLPFTPFRDRLR